MCAMGAQSVPGTSGGKRPPTTTATTTEVDVHEEDYVVDRLAASFKDGKATIVDRRRIRVRTFDGRELIVESCLDVFVAMDVFDCTDPKNPLRLVVVFPDDVWFVCDDLWHRIKNRMIDTAMELYRLLIRRFLGTPTPSRITYVVGDADDLKELLKRVEA